jgi:hypothetical protein
VSLSLVPIPPPAAAAAAVGLPSLFFFTNWSTLKARGGVSHVFPLIRDLGLGGGLGFLKLALPEDVLVAVTDLSLVVDPNTDPRDSMLPAACMLLLASLLPTLTVSEVSEW